MRIPTYDAQTNLVTPQLNTPRVADPIDLSKAIDFVENQYEQGRREREQAYKLFAANETSRAQLAIDQEYAKAQEAIQNGDYGAEKRFQKFYDATVKESVNRLRDNPAAATSASFDYQRSGVEYGLRLKNSVRSKMKADAISNHNALIEQNYKQYVYAESEIERSAALTKINDLHAKATTAGLMSKAKAEESLKDTISRAELDRIKLMGQTNPSAALDSLEAQKEMFSVDQYISQRSALENRLNTVRSFEAAVNSGVTPKQSDVDYVFAEYASNPENLSSEKVVQFINQTRSVPTNIKNIARSALFQDLTDASQEQLLEVYNVANIVVEAQKNPLIKNLENAFNKDTEAVAASIVEKVDAGIPIETAVKSVTKIYSDPDRLSLYNTAKKEALKELSSDVNKIRTQSGKVLDNSLFFGSGSENFDPKIINDYVDYYAQRRALMDNEKTAKEYAQQKVKETYDEFRGVTVKQPPHMLFPQYTKESWEEMASEVENQYRNQGQIRPDETLLLVSGSATMAAVQNLKNTNQPITPDNVPFFVVAASSDKTFRPVMAEVEIDGVQTMRPKVVYGVPGTRLVEKKYSEQGYRAFTK